MKKALLLALVLFFFIFQGCELFLQEEPLGSIHAIYVALNYHGTGVNHLNGTLNDAEDLQECLASLSNRYHRTYHAYSLLQRGGALSSEYDPPSVFASLPTKKNVLAHIAALAQVLTEKDLTIFSYSGHGLDDGSLVLASSSLEGKIILDGKNKPQEEAVLLSVAELLSALSELPGRQLLIMDSCYCGSFVQDSGSSVSLIENSHFLEKALSTYFSSEKYCPSQFVLAATTRDNTSKEPNNTTHSHGFFTAALLEGLGWDHESRSLSSSSPAIKKGVLTTDSLYRYVLENQNYPLKGPNPKYYQHPTISGGAYALRIF